MTYGHVRWLPASSAGVLPARAGEFPAATRPPSPSVSPTRYQGSGAAPCLGQAEPGASNGPSRPQDGAAPRRELRRELTRARRQRRTCLDGLLPGLLVDPRRWPGDRARRRGHTVLGQAVCIGPVLGRRRSRSRLRPFRRTRTEECCCGKQTCRDDGPAHQPTNRDSRADRCGTRPPSASTRSST